MLVDEMVAWAKRQFPGTVMTDKELTAMAETALKRAHKVCRGCGLKFEGWVFDGSAPTAALSRVTIDDDGRVLDWCESCINAWESKQRACGIKPERKPTPLKALRPADSVRDDEIL